ncbi:MAG: D-glycerate dehydrogenase [Verrucomicrobiales bacterium]|jgi:glyoxylate reductase|nr:D-glycerate dehydrogenase [Verrucomicrobiales bacterium]MDB4789666.1 D-glycerate dehydrogenase [Verrucomicrobiales bacterium]
MSATILVTNQAPKGHFPALKDASQPWVFASDSLALMPRKEVLAHAQDAIAIINQGELRVDTELLDHAPNLKVVANVAIGTDNFDLQAMAARKVWATNAPDAFTESTADAAIALLLDVTRRVSEGDRFLRTGAWASEGMRPARWEGPLLSGKTLGLVGYGKIGQAVAQRARAFGMRVLYNRSQDVMDDPNYRSLNELLPAVDVLSLHTPLTPSTRCLLDAKRLGVMKRGSYLINVARGKVVDESALVAALQDGQLAGAGLDVFEEEPIVHPELLSMTNVVLTPHLGGAAREAREAARHVAAENVARVLAGNPPITPVI